MASDGASGDRRAGGCGGGAVSRRRFLAAGITVAASLAGCADGGAGPRTERASPTAAGDATSTTTAQETATTTATDTSTPTQTPTYADNPRVVLADESFTPRRLRVRSGTTVTWVNEDTTSHTVDSAAFNPESATDWSFYSADIVPGNRVRYTFETTGVYEYFCTVHGQDTMCGVVLVGDVTYHATLPCEL